MIKPKTGKSISQIIQEQLEIETQENAFAKQVLELLRPFEGKKPTKHIENKIKKIWEKQYPSNMPQIYLGPRYGWTALEIWGGFTGFSYDNRPAYILCYDSDPIFTVKFFEDHNARYLKAAEERNNERQEYLAKDDWEELELLIIELKEARERLKDKLEQTPDKYLIRQEFEFEV